MQHPLSPLILEQPSHKLVVEPSAFPAPSGGLFGQELFLLPIDDIFPRVKVRGQGRPTLRLLDPLVPEDHDEIQRDAQVSRDEILVVEGRRIAGRYVHEDVEVLENGDDDAEDEREPGPVQPERRDVVELVVRDALGPARLHEVDVRHEDGDPGQQAEDGDEVHEVSEDFARVVRHVEEGDAGDQGGEAEGVDGDAAGVGASKNVVA